MWIGDWLVRTRAVLPRMVLTTPQRGIRLKLQYVRIFIEAKVLIEKWRREYNQVRPHGTRNNRPPVPEAIVTVALT